MRFTRAIPFAVGAVLFAACGGGDSTGPSNTPPTAVFAFSCAQLACTFDGTGSSDSDGNVASYSWDFGDQSPAGSGANAQHTYAADGPYTVTLTVTDNRGATGKISHDLSVAAGSPTAAFQVTCSATTCTFQDQSTDADGTVASWAWDFGDGTTSTEQNPPAHDYAVTTATQFTVTLTVTDNDGLTGTASQTFNVAPPAGLTCDGQACTLPLPQASTVVVTLVSSDCQVQGNTFVITAPVTDTLFTDGCFSPAPGTSFTLNNGAAFTPGTELEAQVISGFAGTTSPQLQVTGDYANGWTLSYDDGFVGPNEPDFNDLIITVKATPSP